MVSGDVTAGAVEGRYGPVGFVAALTTILFVDFLTWICLPWIVLAIFFLAPFFLLTLTVSAIVARRPERAGQVGRGIFIGTLAGPLSLLVFPPAFLAASTMGIL